MPVVMLDSKSMLRKETCFAVAKFFVDTPDDRKPFVDASCKP